MRSIARHGIPGLGARYPRDAHAQHKSAGELVRWFWSSSPNANNPNNAWNVNFNNGNVNNNNKNNANHVRLVRAGE